MFQYVVTLGGEDGTLCLPFANPISSDQLSNEVVSTLHKRAVAASTTFSASSDDNDSPYFSLLSSSTLSAQHLNPTFLFIRNGKPILDLFSPIVINQTSTEGGNFGNSVFLTAIYRGALRGGKGGFGANLRAAGRAAGKKSTTDFGLCRDLQGRRLRDVNNEIRLKTWLAPSEVARREQLGADYRELKGEGGLSGWFLGVPSWADGVSGGGGSKGGSAGLMDRKRKTSVCVDWKKAREGRNAPSNAPRWWGCPRGRACDFAHGDEELRGRGGGGGGSESVAETAKKRALAERQARLDAYTKGLYVYGGGDNEEEEEEGRGGSVNKGMHSSVAQGMLEASSSTLMASRMGGLVGKGGGVKRKRSNIGIDDISAQDDDHDDDDNIEESEEDDDGAIMIGFAKSKSRPSSKHGDTWKGVFSSKSSSATVGGVDRREILNGDLLSSSSSSSPPSILSVSEAFSPLKWLVVSDAPIGRGAVLGEASAAVDYHSISVTPLEDTLIKEGEEGTKQSSSASSSSMTVPLASNESSIAEVTGLIEFATVAVSGVHIKASSTSLSSSSSSSTVSSSSCCYYYEVELITCTGIVQIGWAIDGFAPNVGEGNGVGDCSKSWAFDGLRGLFWHGEGNEDESEEGGGAVPFAGPTWAAGDVIGCWLRPLLRSEERKEEKKIVGDHQHQSLIKDKVEIGLCVNGEAIGQAIVVEVDIGLRGGFFPAISIDAGEIVRVNLGRKGFAYPSGKTCMI